MTTDTFLFYESEARSYCRAFPNIFSKAKDSYIFNDSGERYIDFFSGAGALNYGHNNEKIKAAVINYIQDDGLMMGLDFHTKAKKNFIEAFQNKILTPRGLNYKMQFTSPTGTSVVESAIKLARKVTGRQNVVAFTNAYHGMTGVALGLTGNKYHRQSVAYSSITRLPYENYCDGDFDTLSYFRKLFTDNSSGIDLPAAIILETVQGEGGLNIASVPWLRELSLIAKEFGILLIIDDVQAGCGRTGKFFSFERADIEPDMICLSKSIGGMGFPMAILLLNKELDIWLPGEDNGTFRGNNIAFVAATEAINSFWSNSDFERDIEFKAKIIEKFCYRINELYSSSIESLRGIGLMQGISFFAEEDTKAITKLCFQNKLIIETCGARDQVLKIMPALTISPDVLEAGLAIIEKAIDTHLSNKNSAVDSVERNTEEALA